MWIISYALIEKETITSSSLITCARFVALDIDVSVQSFEREAIMESYLGVKCFSVVLSGIAKRIVKMQYTTTLVNTPETQMHRNENCRLNRREIRSKEPWIEFCGVFAWNLGFDLILRFTCYIQAYLILRRLSAKFRLIYLIENDIILRIILCIIVFYFTINWWITIFNDHYSCVASKWI